MFNLLPAFPTLSVDGHYFMRSFHTGMETSIDVLPVKNPALCKYFKHVGNKYLELHLWIIT